MVKPMKNNVKCVSLQLVNNIHEHSYNYLLNNSTICPCYGTLPNFLNYDILTKIGRRLDNDVEIMYNKTGYIYHKEENDEEN